MWQDALRIVKDYIPHKVTYIHVCVWQLKTDPPSCVCAMGTHSL